LQIIGFSAGRTEADRSMWKRNYRRKQNRFLAAGAGAVILTCTILSPVAVVPAGQQETVSEGTESSGQTGILSGGDASSQDGTSGGTLSPAITDTGSDAESPADGIDASGSDGGSSVQDNSSQSSAGQGAPAQSGESGSAQESPVQGETTPSDTNQEQTEQTRTGIRELLVFPEDLPIVFLTDTTLVTDEKAESLIGEKDDGVYVLSGQKIQFRLDEKEAQKEWHARSSNDPDVPDRRYAAFDEKTQQIEVLTSLLENVSCEYNEKNDVYTFSMPEEAVSIRSVEKRADGVVVIPGYAGSVISEDNQNPSENTAGVPDGISDEGPEDTSETAPEDQDGIAIVPESESGTETGDAGVKTDDETEAAVGTEADPETEELTETEGLAGLTFKSSDEKVAVVGKDGQITGVAPGTAVISVYKDGKLKSQMKVTIR
jgi:hypothetical protein